MEIKKTTKWDLKLKGIHFVGDQLVDDSGVIIDITDVLKKGYGELPFDFAATAKEEESVDIETSEDGLEVDMDDLAPDDSI